ncbi:MAG: chromosomal replication initiator protein DnaA [Clostridiales bacterium]|nr:chromosomal replication initiator protein DnaA [Clostridiales bacterium]
MKKKIDEKKWNDILSEISKNITEVSYRTWFSPLTPLEIDEDAQVIYFASSNDFLIDILKNRYISIFEKSVETIYGKKYKVVLKDKTEEEIEDFFKGDKDKKSKKNFITEESELREEYYLNPRYNFDNFIVGANNNYAHAVALAVAESPAVVYNPLFIYGGSGLGKTHLMHAIGHYILQKNPSLKVLYVSSEMFTSELIKALQDKKAGTSKINSFKKKYRSVDVLLIDDIQFIEGKDATEVEFFHTFNTLYEFKKQIVITSDRHPSQLKNLDERLRSRFQWNIVADIQPPDFETRVAILRNKAELENVEIDDDLMDVINLIAEKVKFNIRELESALTRIISYSMVFKQKINIKFARKNLNDIFSTGDFNITCESIKKEVCKKYGIKITDMESSKRKREFSYPRQIAMYICREMTDSSLPKIGKSFGGRDHTTVLHAYDKIASELKTNDSLANDIMQIKNELQ